MKIKKIIIGLAMALSAGDLRAQDAIPSLSIKECLDYASGNNSNIKLARYDEEIAKQQNNQVRGRGLPQANITGQWQNSPKIQKLIIPPAALAALSGGKADTNTTAPSSSSPNKGISAGYRYSTNLTGEVTQMIFDPSFWVGLKAAKYNRMVYMQTTQQVSEQTAYNIANAYYQVIVIEKRLQLLQSNLNNTGKLLSSTQLQFENGVAKQVDVNRIKVNFNNLKFQYQEAELNLLQALNALKYQMGMPLEQSILLKDTSLAFTEEEGIMDDSVQNYAENRISYKLAKTNITLQDLDRRNNFSGYYPSLTGYANYAYNAQGPTLGLYKTKSETQWINYTTASFGVRLRFNVFDGLQRNALVQQSKLKTRKMEENLNLTKQNINLEVSNARTQYMNTLSRIKAEQQNVDLAQQVYQVTQLEFREGVGTSTAVVQAETSLQQAQNTYISTLLDLYKARLDIERAKGNILPYLNSK
jgi:outer membrane protein TolC